MKIIVTHIHPDLDAITSVWLVARFFPSWEEASIEFVAAGTTYNNQLPDADANIIHLDTGLGKFDHHQTDAYTSATKLVYEYLISNDLVPGADRDALERLITHVNDIDHFAEVNFPEPTSDRYEFTLSQIIEGLNSTLTTSGQVLSCTLLMLDALLQLFKNKIKAEQEIKKGFVFQSSWGKSIAMETRNEEAMKLSLKMGYSLVIRKDPAKGNVRIKTLPKKELDLTPIYNRLKELDPKATWFLHSSKNILLNGSSKGPNMIPTTLPLKLVIEKIQEI